MYSTMKPSDAAKSNSDGNGDSSFEVVSAFSHAAAMGLAICDDRMRYCSVNSALAGFNGFPIEAHLGNQLGEVLGDAAKPVELMFRRVFATGQVVSPREIVLTLPTRNVEGH